MSNERGNIRVTDDVIAVCAAKAAIDSTGVHSLAAGFLADTISENILRKSPEARGVRVSQNDSEVGIDLYIIVEYGIKIPSAAWNIQEQVKKAVEELCGKKVSYVNIHVQGIHFSE